MYSVPHALVLRFMKSRKLGTAKVKKRATALRYITAAVSLVSSYLDQ